MHPLLPDILLVTLGFVAMVMDLIFRGETPAGFRKVYHVTWIGLVAVLVALAQIPLDTTATFIGTYRISPVGLTLRWLFVIAALLTVWLSRPWFERSPERPTPLQYPGEFLYLILFATAGSCFVVSSMDLLTLFVSLELATIPLYVLTAYDRNNRLSAEAATKYIVMGSVATAIMLFGYSYLYGITGSLRFSEIGTYVAANPDQAILKVALLLVLGAIGFKLALAPFHMWAPDVYAGAPLPVVAFLSVTSKATAFGFLIVLLAGPFLPLWQTLTPWIVVLAVCTMVIGNLGALRQDGFLRFMAYSSIAQAGYSLLAFVGNPAFGVPALLFYLFVYTAANFTIFFIMAVVTAQRGETISSLRGLSHEHPGLAGLLATALFSLAGIPPMAGFTGKFMLFGAAAETGHYNLIIFAALNSTVSLYYYLQVMRAAYITPAPAEARPPIVVGHTCMAILVLLLIATLFLGLCPHLVDLLARVI